MISLPNYCEFTLGNASDTDSGVISVSIVFPEDFSGAAAFLPDRTVEYRGGKEMHFQVSEVKCSSGTTFKVGVKAEALPDMTKIHAFATSRAGDFSQIPRVLYDRAFKLNHK